MSVESAGLPSLTATQPASAQTPRAYVFLLAALLGLSAFAPLADVAPARLAGGLLLLWSLLGACLSIRALQWAWMQQPPQNQSSSLPQKLIASLRRREINARIGPVQLRRQEGGLLAALALGALYAALCLKAPGPQGALWLAQALMPGLSFAAAYCLSLDSRQATLIRGAACSLLLAAFLTSPYDAGLMTCAQQRAALLGPAGALILLALGLLMAGFFVQLMLRAAKRPPMVRGAAFSYGFAGLGVLFALAAIDTALPASPGIFTLYILGTALLASLLAGAQNTLPRVRSLYQIYQM